MASCKPVGSTKSSKINIGLQSIILDLSMLISTVSLGCQVGVTRFTREKTNEV